ncbi:MAG: DnaA/Hda family protein [Phycisphaerales bacterium]
MQTTHHSAGHTPEQSPGYPSSHAQNLKATSRNARSIDEIKTGLISRLGEHKVRRYLGAGIDIAPDAQGLRVSAGDRFTIDMIERRVGDDLRAAFCEHTGDPSASVQFTVRDAGLQSSQQSSQHTVTTPPPGRHAGTTRQDHNAERLVAGSTQSFPSQKTKNQHQRHAACPTIEGYLVGQSNKLAFGAIKALLESPTDTPPVYIHGSCGLGKTHLLRAAAQRYRQMHPGARVRYTTGEAFTNSFVQAVRTKTVDAFEKRFRGLDVLCLDDVHLVAGKESTQHELLQIFNTLSLSGAKVIIASDAPPNEIARLNTGLASRFNGGVVARIDAPDRDLGIRLARLICNARGIMIDDLGLGTILDRTGIGSGASVRELEGAIVQVQAVARLLDQHDSASPNMTSIHRALELRTGSTGPQRSLGPISMSLVIQIVIEHLGVSMQDLTGRGRHRTVVLARELIVHLCRELTTNSFPEIAHAIGRPNHSTVITAAKRIRGRIQTMEQCTHTGPDSGITVHALALELTDRVRQQHNQRAKSC